MKKYQDGGKVDWAKDLGDYVREKTFRPKYVRNDAGDREPAQKKSLPTKIKNYASDAGLALLATGAEPFAAMASGLYNSRKDIASAAEKVGETAVSGAKKAVKKASAAGKAGEAVASEATKAVRSAASTAGKAGKEAANKMKGNESNRLRYDRSEKKKTDDEPKMAKGGSVSRRADGCAIRGKTRGRMI
jgi:hypothetical protein